MGADADARPIVVDESKGKWGAPTVLSGHIGGLVSVSCSDAKDCTAVGSYYISDATAGTPSQLIYAVESAGRWGPSIQLPAPDVEPQFLSVSCATPQDCAAVGYDSYAGQMIAASESDGAWGPVTELKGPGGGGVSALLSVSCTTAGRCIAVGNDAEGHLVYVTESAGTWGPVTELPGFGELYSISCTGTEDCTAVGYTGSGPAYVTESAGTWGPLMSGPSAEFTTISCTDARDCTAFGTGSVPPLSSMSVFAYSTETAGRWGPVFHMPRGNSYPIDDISCVGPMDCTAVGDNGFWPAHTGTVPGVPTIRSIRTASDRVTVAFSPPARDGGEPILGYTILVKGLGEYYVPARTSPNHCRSSPCTAVGLKSGGVYTVEVEATSQNGQGPPSAPSGRVTLRP